MSSSAKHLQRIKAYLKCWVAKTMAFLMPKPANPGFEALRFQESPTLESNFPIDRPLVQFGLVQVRLSELRLSPPWYLFSRFPAS